MVAIAVFAPLFAIRGVAEQIAEDAAEVNNRADQHNLGCVERLVLIERIRADVAEVRSDYNWLYRRFAFEGTRRDIERDLEQALRRADTHENVLDRFIAEGHC